MQEHIARRAPQTAKSPTRERPQLRRRLTVGPADDPYEREADTVAAQVVADLQRGPVTEGATGVQRRASDETNVGAGGGDVSAATQGRIRPMGDRFDGETRQRMEGAFGADFSDVRVHTGATIDTAAEGLSADAFTLGSDVYVRRSLYRPGTAAGDNLLAHELTHTLQQGGSRIRRSTTGVGVSTGMPADRISRKKRMMYLDFVKMKRYDPKYGKAIKEALGIEQDDDTGTAGTWGHWWTEVGERNPLTGEFSAKKSYGWWPEGGVGGAAGALAGVPGELNHGLAVDPHHGETNQPGLTEFYPAMNVDTDVESYDQIKSRITNQIDSFAHGYAGKWQWKLGWGQNCHTFQQSMKTKVKMHYQSAKGFLDDPKGAEKATADIKEAKEKKEAEDIANAENLQLVSGKKWFVWNLDGGITTTLPDGDDGPILKLDGSKEFALSGAKRRFGYYHCQEVVTRLGGRGWVSEHELKEFSNMR